MKNETTTVKNEKGEILILGHDPWPGYKKAFWLVFGAACMYLAVILYSSFQHLPIGHH